LLSKISLSASVNTLKTEDVTFTLADSNSSELIEGAGDEEAMYVVMPMRL